ncbi:MULTISPECIES: hypothetical protein [Microbacterium]|uniref:Uncharacterized protein n=1 Tax=Microbacterium maritypicum MF109 TaxID=1333857 RepID=T5KS74_MICMQ|nr:hypothetical protein [Microbacterium liquefaciens]EQM81866.1 hypothetical protein L687_00475 [Microbacterium maritypicum MF109]
MKCLIENQRLYPCCAATAIEVELCKIFWNFSSSFRDSVTQTGMKPAVHTFKISEELADVVFTSGGASHCPLDEVKLMTSAVTEAVAGG